MVCDVVAPYSLGAYHPHGVAQEVPDDTNADPSCPHPLIGCGDQVVVREVKAKCGNGAIEAGEICDDGNDVETDACTGSASATPAATAFCRRT